MTNEKQVTEIKTLSEEVAKFKHELEVCKKWQNTVYVDMEKTIMQYQQYYQSMAYMNMGYLSYQSMLPSTSGLASAMPQVSFPAMCVPSSYTDNFINNNSQSNTDIPQSAVTESAAVFYGDSRKLTDRK